MQVTRTYFKECIEQLFIDLTKYTSTEVAREGIAIGTAQKVKSTVNKDFPDEIVFRFRTDTISNIAKAVDRLNRKSGEKNNHYEKKINTAIKTVVTSFLSDKSFTELNSLNILPRAQVSKLIKHKYNANYYMETVVILADFIEKTVYKKA